MLSSRCTGLLQSLWPSAWGRQRLAAARVPNRSLHKPSLPCLHFGSTTRLFLVTWRLRVPTFSVRPSRFSGLMLPGDECSSPVRGVSPAPCSTGFCLATPICRASVQEPLSESPGSELYLSSKFITMRSILVSQVKGYYKVHQVEPRPW